MTRRATFVVLLAATMSVAGCARAGVGGEPAVDTSIAAVSASHPSVDAAAALDACSIVFTRPGFSGGYGLGIVTGMGEITPGRDASKYAPLGNLAEIQTDAPVWVITTRGTIDLPLAGQITDGTCVVTQGGWTQPAWIVTGTARNHGVTATAFPEPPAILRLPPLAP